MHDVHVHAYGMICKKNIAYLLCIKYQILYHIKGLISDLRRSQMSQHDFVSGSVSVTTFFFLHAIAMPSVPCRANSIVI